MPSWRWVELFARQFELCGATRGQQTMLLCDSDTEPELVMTARLALQRCDASPVLVEVNPSRGTGVDPLGDPMALAAAKQADLIIDCTIPGIRRSKLIGEVGARVLGIGNDHPRDYQRFTAHPGLKRRVSAAAAALGDASQLTLTSPDGTDLSVELGGSQVVADWGGVGAPGDVAIWPGGSVKVTPASGTVKGRLVVAPSDVNLTFREYAGSRVVIEINSDHITEIIGEGGDADLLRRYFSEFSDTSALGISAIGWGMHQTSRRGKPLLHDPDLIAKGEAGLLAGLCLVSFGSNPVAERATGAQLALSLQGVTVNLDDVVVVDAGKLVGDLAPDVYEMAATG